VLCIQCARKGRNCILVPGIRACQGCTASHLGCSLVPATVLAKGSQTATGRAILRGTGGKGKGKETEGKRPPRLGMMSVNPPVLKRAAEEAQGSGGSVVEVTSPRKRARARRIPSVSSEESTGELEKVMSELRVGVQAMTALAENFMATARLLDQSMERLEREVKKLN
jgi:orotidine-5'-phosphate decarboxylase